MSCNRFDIDTTVKDLLSTAVLYRILDGADILALGINQGESDDWEDYENLVQFVCDAAFAARHMDGGKEAHAAVIKKAEQYWQEQHEAKADAACEYTGPEL